MEALKAQKLLAEQGIETAILKLNVINPILPEMAEMLMEYKNIYSFEEHVRNGSVSAKLGLTLLEKGFKNNYSYKCAENYTVYHANVGELQQICKIDAESIVKKIKENYEN